MVSSIQLVLERHKYHLSCLIQFTTSVYFNSFRQIREMRVMLTYFIA